MLWVMVVVACVATTLAQGCISGSTYGLNDSSWKASLVHTFCQTFCKFSEQVSNVTMGKIQEAHRCGMWLVGMIA